MTFWIKKAPNIRKRRQIKSEWNVGTTPKGNSHPLGEFALGEGREKLIQFVEPTWREVGAIRINRGGGPHFGTFCEFHN